MNRRISSIEKKLNDIKQVLPEIFENKKNTIQVISKPKTNIYMYLTIVFSWTLIYYILFIMHK